MVARDLDGGAVRRGRYFSSCRAWPLPLCLSAMTMLLGFPDHLDAVAGSQTEVWTTRPAYQIDNPEGTDGGFGSFRRMRIGGNGTRLVVQDAELRNPNRTKNLRVCEI